MITYTCDICGKPMPSGYQRPDKRRGRDSLPALCVVDDVCPACEQAAGKINVQRVLFRAWRDAVAPKDPAPQDPAPVLREHDAKALADLTDAEIKRKVVAQIQAYRDAHGLGCFGKLAMRIHRKGITDIELRDILNGGALLDMADWRRVSAVMDRIELEEVNPNA